MPLVTGSKTKPDYNVIVVGSGAGGAMTACAPAMATVKILMLEAGRNYDPVKETPMFQWPKDALLRDASTPEGTLADPDLIGSKVALQKLLTDPELATLAALCDTFIPQDEHSPSARAARRPETAGLGLGMDRGLEIGSCRFSAISY